jgi:hypothetical protein
MLEELDAATTDAIEFAVAGMGACRGRPIHLPYRGGRHMMESH